jgi:antitoxin ParD1/3/4
MESMNISLPEPLKRLVDEQIAAGRYSSVSEYVRALIREDERRKAEERLEELLLEGLEGEESPPDQGRLGFDPQGSLGARSRPNAGVETADRFLARAEESLANLLVHPNIGAAIASRRPDLAGLRR